MKNRMLCAILALVMAAALVTAMPAFAAEEGTLVYAATDLNVRSGAGMQYAIIGSLDAGQTAAKIGTSGNWTQIAWKDGTAFVSSRHIKEAAVADSGILVMRAEGLAAIYASADAGSKVLGVIPAGTAFAFVEAGEGWLQVSYHGVDGFVKANVGSVMGQVGYLVDKAAAPAGKNSPEGTAGVIPIVVRQNGAQQPDNLAQFSFIRQYIAFSGQQGLAVQQDGERDQAADYWVAVVKPGRVMFEVTGGQAQDTVRSAVTTAMSDPAVVKADRVVLSALPGKPGIDAPSDGGRRYGEDDQYAGAQVFLVWAEAERAVDLSGGQRQRVS